MSIDRFEILSIAEILYRNDLVKKLEIDPNSEFGMKTLNDYLEQERISDILCAKRNLKNNNHGEFIKQSEIRTEAERIKNERLEPYIKKAIRKHQEQDIHVLEKTYKKYIGIIKIYTDYISGTQIKLLSKTYDEPNLLNIWFNMYPNSEHLLLENTQELDEMFEIFKDMTPITEEEQKSMEIAKVLYENLMNDSNGEKEQSGPVLVMKKNSPRNTGNE